MVYFITSESIAAIFLSDVALRKILILNLCVLISTFYLDYNSLSLPPLIYLQCAFISSTNYLYTSLQAELLEDFLLPMLDFVPSKRVTAGQCLSHQWLKSSKKEDIAHD